MEWYYSMRKQICTMIVSKAEYGRTGNEAIKNDLLRALPIDVSPQPFPFKRVPLSSSR